MCATGYVEQAAVSRLCLCGHVICREYSVYFFVVSKSITFKYQVPATLLHYIGFVDSNGTTYRKVPKTFSVLVFSILVLCSFWYQNLTITVTENYQKTTCFQ